MPLAGVDADPADPADAQLDERDKAIDEISDAHIESLERWQQGEALRIAESAKQQSSSSLALAEISKTPALPPSYAVPLTRIGHNVDQLRQVQKRGGKKPDMILSDAAKRRQRIDTSLMNNAADTRRAEQQEDTFMKMVFHSWVRTMARACHFFKELIFCFCSG